MGDASRLLAALAEVQRRCNDDGQRRAPLDLE
jgi:hypothetical protein